MAKPTAMTSNKARQSFERFRRRLFPWAVCLLLLVGLAVPCLGRDKAVNDFAGAVEFLAREQALAETYVTILKEFGKSDIEKFVRGIELYGKARAEYNALIARLQYELTNGQAPDTSAEFQQKLDQAATHRVAFTDFVAQEFIKTDPNAKAAAGALAVLTTVKELLPPLLDAGIKIWQEYRKGDAQEKRQILDQLDSYKWKEFN